MTDKTTVRAHPDAARKGERRWAFTRDYWEDGEVFGMAHLGTLWMPEDATEADALREWGAPASEPDESANDCEGFAPFTAEDGSELEGTSCEVFWNTGGADGLRSDECDECEGKGESADGLADCDECEGFGFERLAIGWYWWACYPGCLPDGEPSGPFRTSAEALESARS